MDAGELKLETASGIVIGSGRPFFVTMESAGLVDAVDRGGMIAERKFDGRTNNAQGAGGIRRYNEVQDAASMAKGVGGEARNVSPYRTAIQPFLPRVKIFRNHSVVADKERGARIAVYEATFAVLERYRGGAGKMRNGSEGCQIGDHHR